MSFGAQQAAASRARTGEHDEPTRGLRQDRASEQMTERTRETQLGTQGRVDREAKCKKRGLREYQLGV